MAKNLVEKGSLEKPLLVYNRSKKPSDDLVEKLGAEQCQAIDSVVEGVERSDIIFSCLKDDAAVKEILGDIAKSVDVKGKTFIECSTIFPDTTDEVVKMMTDAGAEFVACPGASIGKLLKVGVQAD
jgi:3-hydroxyisobutyrate dehydrogenase-like beta-hydroxyacid dehydrogenase